MTDAELAACLVRRATELEAEMLRALGAPVSPEGRRWARSVARHLAEDEARERARELRAAGRRDP